MKKASIVLALLICVAGVSCSADPRIVYVTAGDTSQTTTSVPPSTTTAAPAAVHVSPASYELPYQQTAVTLNSSITQGVQIIVVKAGYFSASTTGAAINYLRVDMQVVNTSPDPTTFQPGNIAVASSAASSKAQYLFDPGDSSLYQPNYSVNQSTPFIG